MAVVINDTRLLKGASHCEIDAKVLQEVGLEMHLHTDSEGFRNGLVGTILAAEGVGLAQPLVSPNKLRYYRNSSSILL